MRLLYFMFEFQPTSEARRPYGRQCGQIHEKSKVNNETSGKNCDSQNEGELITKRR
jgi:hypothetical protein